MPRKFSGALSRQRRLSAGLRPESVALSIGRSWYSVREYETGRVIPSTPVLLALADLYGCAVDDLLVNDDDAAAESAVPVPAAKVARLQRAKGDAHAAA